MSKVMNCKNLTSQSKSQSLPEFTLLILTLSSMNFVVELNHVHTHVIIIVCIHYLVHTHCTSYVLVSCVFIINLD